MTFVSRFLACCFVMTVLAGCDSAELAIFVKNNSGCTIKNVTVIGDNKKCKFGTISNNTDAGFMTAHQIFGESFPKELKIEFETEAGEVFTKPVTYNGSLGDCRRLEITVGIEVTGKCK